MRRQTKKSDQDGSECSSSATGLSIGAGVTQMWIYLGENCDPLILQARASLADGVSRLHWKVLAASRWTEGDCSVSGRSATCHAAVSGFNAFS